MLDYFSSLFDYFSSLSTQVNQVLLQSPAVTAFLTGLGFVIGAISAALLNRKNLLRAHNFAAISQLTQSSSQAAAYSKILRFIAHHKGAEIPVAEFDRDMEEQAVVFLGTYQFLAIAADKRFINRRLVRTQFVPSMRSTLTSLHAFIKHYRDQMNRPKMWSEMEAFVRRDGYRWHLTAWVMRLLRSLVPWRHRSQPTSQPEKGNGTGQTAQAT